MQRRVTEASQSEKPVECPRCCARSCSLCCKIVKNGSWCIGISYWILTGMSADLPPITRGALSVSQSAENAEENLREQVTRK